MRRRLQFTLLIAALLLVPDAPCLAVERFNIDSDHTFSVFEYSHWGLSLQRGRFEKNSGFIELDMGAKTGAIDIEIEAISINTGIGFFDRILRSGDFFDAGNYPKITFKSSRLQFDDERLVKVDGDLTIKGITKPTTLEITYFDCGHIPVYGKRACGANGYARMRRSDFGLGRYAPFVSDVVTLYVTVEAVKEH